MLVQTNFLSERVVLGAIDSDWIVAEIVDGKRSIDSIQAKALGEYFQVSAILVKKRLIYLAARSSSWITPRNAPPTHR